MIDNHVLLNNTIKVIIFNNEMLKHFKYCNILYYFATFKNITSL
jgi:hypothetical protein